MKRFVIFSIFFLGVAIFVGLRYLPSYSSTENIDDLALSKENKEKLFSEAFPSREDVESYFFDATILLSYPPVGNNVWYFSDDGRYFEWHSDDLKSGHWSITPVKLRRTYQNKQRVDVAYSLCRDTDDGSLYPDNCAVMTDKNHLFMFNIGRVEYAKGDLFQLSTRTKAPFALPSAEITLKQISAALNR